MEVLLVSVLFRFMSIVARCIGLLMHYNIDLLCKGWFVVDFVFRKIYKLSVEPLEFGCKLDWVCGKLVVWGCSIDLYKFPGSFYFDLRFCCSDCCRYICCDVDSAIHFWNASRSFVCVLRKALIGVRLVVGLFCSASSTLLVIGPMVCVFI